MEQTLRAFEKLPPEQRELCLRSFSRFALMTEPERRQFLATAERWRAMTPAERETWRGLVTKLPPVPPGLGEAPTRPSP